MGLRCSHCACGEELRGIKFGPLKDLESEHGQSKWEDCEDVAIRSNSRTLIARAMLDTPRITEKAQRTEITEARWSSLLVYFIVWFFVVIVCVGCILGSWYCIFLAASTSTTSEAVYLMPALSTTSATMTLSMPAKLAAVVPRLEALNQSTSSTTSTSVSAELSAVMTIVENVSESTTSTTLTHTSTELGAFRWLPTLSHTSTELGAVRSMLSDASTSTTLTTMTSTSTKLIAVKTALEHIDYMELLGQPELVHMMVQRLKAAIAAEVGHSVTLGQVDISLHPGSVQVDATVSVPSSVAQLIVLNLVSSTTFCPSIGKVVRQIEGIDSVAYGQITAWKVAAFLHAP